MPTKLGEEVLQALLVHVRVEALHVDVGELQGPSPQLRLPFPARLEVTNVAVGTPTGWTVPVLSTPSIPTRAHPAALDHLGQ
jgi:hypothetical protein